ncbi:putative HAD family hydrolase [Magnetofaba australis IT-1]|uniref:Putative HAD family hydrolase n=1 Tax=Magnetofaba australis IT-1 TaxID=1434232 RepID=A0A1Y2K298_9PROT|nr:putative HAD family hydrolase [Magnetofaba australis IT-1]
MLLDMDGTLLDRHFDDHFFLDTTPRQYAKQNGLDFETAKAEVLAIYEEVAGSLLWYDLDHWSKRLQMDIPLLKLEIAHLIQTRPYVMPFLQCLKERGLPTHLVTNAHAHSLNLKLARTPIGQFMDSVHSSHDYGLAKEQPAFWTQLRGRIDFNPQTTLLIEDSEPVLRSAEAFGIGHLLHIAQPNLQWEPQYSQRFPSVQGFEQLLQPASPPPSEAA